MTYEQLVNVIGTPGTEVKDPQEKSAGIKHYHWSGGKDSALDVRFSSGRLLDGSMLAPNGNRYPLGK